MRRVGLGTMQRSVTATARSHLGGARLQNGWRAGQRTRSRPRLVVCSSAVRAQQTLQRVLPALGEPEVWVEVTLYAAGAETLLARIRTLSDEADEVMLVGHNPGLREVLLLLAGPGKLRERAEREGPGRGAC